MAHGWPEAHASQQQPLAAVESRIVFGWSAIRKCRCPIAWMAWETGLFGLKEGLTVWPA
jgi:hypothetical protein